MAVDVLLGRGVGVVVLLRTYLHRREELRKEMERDIKTEGEKKREREREKERERERERGEREGERERNKREREGGKIKKYPFYIKRYTKEAKELNVPLGLQDSRPRGGPACPRSRFPRPGSRTGQIRSTAKRGRMSRLKKK